MSVAECRQKISSLEFTQWMAFYDMEPWGEVKRPAPAEQAKAQLAHDAITAFNMAMMGSSRK